MRLMLLMLVLLGLVVEAEADQSSALLAAAHRRNQGGGSVAISYLTTHATNSTQSSYTFPGISLGAEAVDRIIWVGVGSRDTGTTMTLTDVTVGGVSGTLAVGTNQLSGGNTSLANLWYATVPTGATGDIVLTFSEATLRARIGVWRVTGQTSLDSDADITVGTVSSLSVNGTTDGALIGVVMTATGSTSFTWAGVSEDYDGTVGTSTSSGGHNAAPSNGANAITATAAGAGATAAVAASIMP